MVEVLRLFIIVFFAGAGYQVGFEVGSDRVFGPLNGTALGLVLGVGAGYVVGGVLGRTATASAASTRTRLHDISAEQLVAGGIGTVGGVLLGAGVAWPLFFLPQAYLAFPAFGFVVVVVGYLGSQIGVSKRAEVLALFGSRAGLAPRTPAAASLDKVLDTSVAIDGRILDVVRAGFLHGRMLVPTPVVAELQRQADASDDLRRGKGRRGLELLEALKREPAVDLEVLEDAMPGVSEVDAKLVRICLDRGDSLLTLDTGLARVARLAGVAVLDLHALALALRPAVAAGDEIAVLLLKAGKETGQAVGYLDDGSMVVVEQARDRIGSDVPVTVTSVLLTANGRLVFGRTPPVTVDLPASPKTAASPGAPATPRPGPGPRARPGARA